MDNTNNKNSSSWIEDRLKQNLYSVAEVANRGLDKSKEIKEDYKKFGNEAANLPGQLAKNRAEREAIFDRESKSDSLTASQKEQLKNISNAEDAQKFVEASILGNQNNNYSAGQSIYEESLRSSGKALLNFGEDVALTAAGGPLIGAGAKLGSKLGGAAIKGGSTVFKGAAEAIGSKLPSLKKYSNVFKTEADIAEEARVAEKARREAAREARYEEIRKNQTRPKNTPFESNAENVAKNEAAAAEAKVAEKEAKTAKTPQQSAPPKTPKQPKVEEIQQPKKPGLFSNFMSGAKKAAIPSLMAGAYYDSLSEDEKKEWQEKAQSGLDEAGNFIEDAVKNPDQLVDKGKNLLDEGKGLLDEGLDKAGELGSTAASLMTGLYVGGGNPFKTAGGIIGGIGSLFASGRSSEATLNAMPSGGDSGMTGESHFGSDDMSGKSAVEILNKIYGVLSRIYDTTQGIARDTSALVRGNAAQDAARDISNANLSARQNEGGSASPIFSSGGGGGGDDSSESTNKDKNEDKKEDKGFWGSLTSKLPKMAKSALGALGGGKFSKAAKFLAGNKGKIATALGAGALFASKDVEAELERQGISDPYAKEAIKAKMMSESGGKGGSEGNWTKTSNSRIREKMPQLRGMSDEELDNLKAQGNEVFLNKAYEKYGGYKYRGRGLTQLTGKDNYAAADKALGLNGELVNNPDILSTDKDLDRKVSVWFYKNAGGDKKKFASQEEANKWAIRAAGGKKYSPGTALGEGELSRLNNIQSSAKNKNNQKENINSSSIRAENQQNDNTILIDGNSSNKETTKEQNFIQKTSFGGNVNVKTNPEVQLTEEQKAYEAYEKDPLHNPNPHSKYTSQYWLDKKDKDLEQQRNTVEKNLKSNKITVDQANAQYDEINRQQNNNEWDKINKTTPTATPVVNSKMDDMQAELDEVDRQKASLQEERDKIAHLSPRDEKEMNEQLDRLSDIHSEMSSLDKRRNDVSGSPEYLSGLEQQKAGGTQQASVQQIPSASPTVPMASSSPAGNTKTIPSVRNDDPTLKLLEEGNMWRTTTHEA